MTMTHVRDRALFGRIGIVGCIAVAAGMLAGRPAIGTTAAGGGAGAPIGRTLDSPVDAIVWSVADGLTADGRWTPRRVGPSGSAPFEAAVRVSGTPRFAPAAAGAGLVRNGIDAALTVVPGGADAPSALEPTDAFTLAAWVSLDATTTWGGIVGRVQDDGGTERGWLLGYRGDGFCVALSTEGADDGDGFLTYLTAPGTIELGRWHHVAATYDGSTTTLFVDGAAVATADTQSGAILPAGGSPLVIGGYRDANEDFPMHGRLADVMVSRVAIDAAAIPGLAGERAAARRAIPPWIDDQPAWIVPPYLTWPRPDGVSVLAETRGATRLAVRVWADGSDPAEASVFTSDEASTIPMVRLTGLAPDRKHFYEVKATAEGVGPGGVGAAVGGTALTHPRRAFRTAASAGRSFTFAIFGDTQNNAVVAKRVAGEAFANRPNFFIVAGDLVDEGPRASDWRRAFFPAMRPLIEFSPMLSVLGNHERDASLYYDYLDLPGEERWYTVRYGDAEFFMIDANRPLDPDSPQYAWLDRALADSTALWKFAVMHQPPYTSDADDYGNTQRGSSARGDQNARHTVALFERHGVDICFSGHVHDYERTLPIRDGVPARWDEGGVIYVTTAGGGGPLEDFDHVNTDFGHRKARRHHGCHVLVHGRTLEFQAIDEHGGLFDVMMLEKPADGSR